MEYGFIGFIELGEDLAIPLLTRASTSLVSTNADGNPAYAIYDADGTSQPVAGASGTFSKRHSGSVSGAVTSGGLIKIRTAAAHGLSTGAIVTIASVGGVSGANGKFQITKVDSTSFTLDGTTFSGTYTSGGSWNVTGLYGATQEIDEANFARNQNYSVVCNYLVSGQPMGATLTFTVV